MARQATVKTTSTNQTAATTMSSLLVAANSLTFSGLKQLGAGAGEQAAAWSDGPDPCKLAHKYQNDANGTAHDYNQHDPDELYVKMSNFWYCFLAFVTAIGLLVSLVSNMIIIYLFTGTPSFRRNPSNIIAVNLSLSDLLYCIQWPSVIYCSLSQSTWLLEIDFVCKTFGFITVTTASASVLTVLAMSVERAIVIKYSIYAKSRYTIRSAWLIVVLIWCVSISSSLPPLFDKFNRFTLDPSKTSCTLDYLSGKTNFKLYMLLIYILYWILPGTIITICYIFIIVTFKRSSRRLAAVGAVAPPPPSWTSCSSNSAATGQRADEVAPREEARFWSSVRSRAPRRVHSRDSIRWQAVWVPALRRSSTTRLAKGRAEAKKVLAPMTTTKSSDNIAGLTTGRNRALARTVVDQSRTAPASSEQVCPQVECVEAPPEHDAGPSGRPRAQGRAHLTGGGARPQTADSRDGSCEPASASGPQPGRQTGLLETSDESSPATSAISSGLVVAARLKIGPTCGHNEQPLTSPSSSSSPSPRRAGGRAPGTLAGEQLDCGSLSDRQVSMNTLRNRHCLDELAIARLHASRHCGQALAGAGGNVAASSEPTTSNSEQGARSCSAKLAIISRVMARLDRASSFGSKPALTTTTNLSSGTSQNELGSAARATPKVAPSDTTQTTCHFGKSSSHSAARASMQIRLAKMSFYLILLWLVSWTPIASLTLINLIVKCHLRANAMAVFLANTMTKLGPTFDVFIYGISHPRIKREFIQIIKRLLMLNNQAYEESRGKSKLGAPANNLSFNSTFHRTHCSMHQCLTLNEDKPQESFRRYRRSQPKGSSTCRSQHDKLDGVSRGTDGGGH